MKLSGFIILVAVTLSIPAFAKADQLESDQIKKLYKEFKQTIVMPLDPSEVKDTKKYKIKNAENYLEKSSLLLDKVNNLLGIVERREEFSLLLIIQDILRLDIENLKLVIDGKLNMRNIKRWYYLHNKWLSELDNWYNRSFGGVDNIRLKFKKNIDSGKIQV